MDPLWTEAETKLAMDWAVTSTQKRGSHGVLALELKSVPADDDAFDGWTARRLDGTLGPEMSQQGAHSQHAAPAATGANPLQMASAAGAGAGAALQVIHQLGPAQQGQ